MSWALMAREAARSPGDKKTEGRQGMGCTAVSRSKLHAPQWTLGSAGRCSLDFDPFLPLWEAARCR